MITGIKNSLVVRIDVQTQPRETSALETRGDAFGIEFLGFSRSFRRVGERRDLFRINPHEPDFPRKRIRKSIADGLAATFSDRLSCNIFVMKPHAFLILALGAIVLAGCRPAAAPIAISNRPVSVNDVPLTSQQLPPSKPVEDMTWAVLDYQTNLEGQVKTLKDFRGRVVILDFWATYCPPCIEEIPHLKELQKKYGADNLEIVGLHVGGAEDRPRVPAFANRLKIDYTVAIPEDELVRFIFGNKDDIPQTAVFGRDGKMLTKIIGFDDRIRKELDAVVEQAINAK